MPVENHSHNGIDSQRLRRNSLTIPMIEAVTDVPTAVPKDFFDSIKIFDDGGGGFLLYVYDNTNGAWRRFDYSP